MRVRFRVDGVMSESTTVPRRMIPGVVSRIKIMADLDIAESRRPQDGRLGLMVEGRQIDIRVVTLPSSTASRGMRILDKTNVTISLDALGMREHDQIRFQKAIGQSHGAVLVTGPTGSGKTTTLYAALGALNTPDKTLITIEDPVEYQLAGIKQIQVNAKVGLTFATGLRSMLRSDPNVIMVGEIRDRETAQIAVESALTGHLVLSTLHTTTHRPPSRASWRWASSPSWWPRRSSASWPSGWRARSAPPAGSRPRSRRRRCSRTALSPARASPPTRRPAAGAAAAPATRAGSASTRRCR